MDAHFCEECGADQGSGQENAKTRERRETTQGNAGGFKAPRGFAGSAEARVGSDDIVLNRVRATLGSEWSEVEQHVQIAAYFGVVEFGILIIALWQLRPRPLPVTLTLTVLRILELAFVGLLAMNTEQSVMSLPALLKYVAITLFYVFATVQAAKLTRLAKENPDAYLARKMRGEATRPSRADGLRSVVAHAMRPLPS